MPWHAVARFTIICVALTVAGAARADLVSHRAFYNVTLKSSAESSDIAGLSGNMALEISDVCDGWALEQRIALIISNFDGVQITSYVTFTSWESKDGLRFRFDQETQTDGIIVDQFSGFASRDDSGGIVTITKPQAGSIVLPAGTLFPNQHTELLIARAEAGDRMVTQTIFDGTSPDSPNTVSAFIAPPRRMPNETGAGDQLVWPVRMAFFPPGVSGVDEPDIEIGVWLQADGIARIVEFSYGDFAMTGTLDLLEILPAKDC